jgi:hypothetical protein
MRILLSIFGKNLPAGSGLLAVFLFASISQIVVIAKERSRSYLCGEKVLNKMR